MKLLYTGLRDHGVRECIRSREVCGQVGFEPHRAANILATRQQMCVIETECVDEHAAAVGGQQRHHGSVQGIPHTVLQRFCM
jgi:hypothetical protein